jgi:ABC-type transporter Mla subunit MlaD
VYMHEYRALVTLQIDQRHNEIPDDSSASIESAGLLGGEYPALQPGASSRPPPSCLAEGDRNE